MYKFLTLAKINIGDSMVREIDLAKIKSAIDSGIDKEAVRSILDDMISTCEKNNQTPAQVGQAIKMIAQMKSSKDDSADEKYLSNLVKNNSDRIKSALNDGIYPDEIATTLVTSVNLNPNGFSFLTKLISIMKSKEERLKMQKSSFQKIKLYEN